MYTCTFSGLTEHHTPADYNYNVTCTVSLENSHHILDI